MPKTHEANDELDRGSELGLGPQKQALKSAKQTLKPLAAFVTLGSEPSLAAERPKVHF